MEADVVQAGVALVMISLCGGNIFLLMGIKAVIRSQTKRIDSLRELVRAHYEVAPKKSRPNTLKQGRGSND